MDDTGKKTVSLGDIIKANLISSAIINGVKALANGLKTLATAAVGVGSDFESGMSQVAATMGITTEEIANGSEEFDKLNKAAKDAGATTQFSATQAAEALVRLIAGGYWSSGVYAGCRAVYCSRYPWHVDTSIGVHFGCDSL